MTSESDIAKAMGKVLSVHANKMRETALRFHSNVVVATPIDEGTARGNWNLSVGIIDYSTSDRTTPQTPEISESDGKKIIFVSNHLPYIERLNDGYSKQAPANFVDDALILTKRQIGG